MKSEITKGIDLLYYGRVEDTNRIIYMTTREFYQSLGLDTSMYNTKNWKERHFKKAYRKQNKG